MLNYRIGLDVGSTTLKCAVLDAGGRIVHEAYQRHFSEIQKGTASMLQEIRRRFPDCARPALCVSGSAGMGMAEKLCLGFEQEVYATRTAVLRFVPGADSAIELGGEDAKILFLSGMTEVRMNGTCAGGTGAFIDQMASLLNVTPAELNELAGRSTETYSIASRCGVFAKSDIQPLLNQGARREDVAASIFAAVVQQTISGLSQGRRIGGNVVYLGGPLTYCPVLRALFDRELGIRGIFPEHSLYFVAVGAALSESALEVDLQELIGRVQSGGARSEYPHGAPLFNSEAEYEAFRARHAKTGAAGVRVSPLANPGTAHPGARAFIGVDAGSTTLKAVAIDEGGAIISSSYQPNTGNPVPLVREFLRDFYREHPGVEIGGAAATGYGEQLIKSAFQMDHGLVETMAHYIAAREFQPDVDFIIDIGGQDIKCFKIRGGAIDNIFLNEACSSGCGSFLQTFAGAIGLSASEFAEKGLFAKRPADLGSRCTVFMNSSVKQAQKDGASVENISAGLSFSVVKNALYKVIRAAGADQLGNRIVVQGGTFKSDAVLRAFEMEIGREVVRPDISELMGAFGAALYAKSTARGKSALIGAEQLDAFTHEVKAAQCSACNNRCKLTINDFGGGKRYVSGNRCDRALGMESRHEPRNLFTYRRELLRQYNANSQPNEQDMGERFFRPARSPSAGVAELRQAESDTAGRKKIQPYGVIGIPLGLNMLELLPFWHAFFTGLGYEVVTSPESDRALYQKGQHTIPSDTVCYPAKLMHGHVQALIERGVDAIFYPCMSYNLDEGLGDNHYNCPVVAYYPEVIAANTADFGGVPFISDYVGIHRPKDFPRKIQAILSAHGLHAPMDAVALAAKEAYREQQAFRGRVQKEGEAYIAYAKQHKLPVIVLVGRPYHMDPEISHGIDQMISGFGAVIVTEDALSPALTKQPTSVLNQWTYHARLYAAAHYVADSGDPNVNLVQLVSFGCGVDAITTDEVRGILEEKGRIYTQIKIDEIQNLGAARIRLRSLFTALEIR